MARKIASYALADVADVTARRIEKVRLPPELFSMLTQVRKTYNIIEDLVPSFLSQGQIYPGLVAALTPDEAVRYVDHVNLIYGSRHSPDELELVELDGELFHLVVFAGHRRLLTKLHVNEGIRENRYPLPEDYDFRYRAELFFGLSAEEAIELQFHENRYAPPPLHEEAEAAWRFYRYQLRRDPKLTLAAFARSIGRRSEWVSNALRFCGLPASIQAYVTGEHEGGVKLSYGILVDLARLAENFKSITGEELGEYPMHLWLKEAVASRLNTAAFSRKVSAYLEEKRLEAAGQTTLFGAASPEDDDRHLRRTVAAEMVRGVWLILQYAKTVQGLHAAKMLGKGSHLGPYLTRESQEYFSPGSPIRIWAGLLEVAAPLTLELAEMARSEGTGHFRKLLNGHPILEHAREAFGAAAAAEHQAAYGTVN